MSNETTVYPEQENPPRPTYEATIRGNRIGGWLYYYPTEDDVTNGRIELKVTVGDQLAHAEDFLFISEAGRKQARAAAKNIWRSAVLGVLAQV